MIYVTGDLHGDKEALYSRSRGLGKGDILIVCGDFGFIWQTQAEKVAEENKILDEISALPFEILFIDGNHENFTRLYKYPETERYSNKVRKIRGNIYYLERGRLYCIEGKNFFTFGGAYSVDKYMRTENVSWWSDELPTAEEYRRSGETLKQAGFRTDYVITHTAPADIIRKIGYFPDYHDMELTGHLEWIEHELTFDKWFFGHFHEDKQPDTGFVAVFEKVHLIDD